MLDQHQRLPAPLAQHRGPIGIDQCADINRYRLRVIHQASVSRNDSVPALALVFQMAHDADSTD